MDVVEVLAGCPDTGTGAIARFSTNEIGVQDDEGGRYSTSRGRRRPSQLRWPCISAGSSPGASGRRPWQTRSSGRRLPAIRILAKPTTGTGSPLSSAWWPRRESRAKRIWGGTVTLGTEPPAAPRTAGQSSCRPTIFRLIKAGESAKPRAGIQIRQRGSPAMFRPLPQSSGPRAAAD